MSSRLNLCCGATLGLALALGACNSATAPSLSDPTATAAQAAALDSAFQSPVVASLQSLSGAVHATPPVVRPAIGALRVLPSVRPTVNHYDGLANEGRVLQQVVPSFASFGATGIFPDTLLGSVFTWDTSAHAYRRTASSGGPTNGVRFLLYAIDPLTDEPSTPLTQVGYVDLMDESANGIARLHIQAKNTAGTITYLDYAFSGSGTSAAFTASVTGTITNGLAGGANKTLTFSVTITGSTSSVTLTSSYALNNPVVAVQETVTISDDGTTTTLGLDFTFTRPAETITIAGTVAVTDATGDGTVNITFKVNGSTFATLTGTTTNPTFTKAGGGQLTTSEQLALASLFVAAADISEKVGDVFQPAEHMLGL